MAGVSENAVMDALGQVRDPDRGKDIVSLGMVQGLVIRDGNIGFSIEVDPERGPGFEPVRKAAEDYAKGVSDGRVTEAHEYQDALGFVRSARSILRSLSAAEKAKHQAVLAEISGDLDSLAVAWPSVVPPGRVDADASLLYGTAARIEIASLKLH